MPVFNAANFTFDANLYNGGMFSGVSYSTDRVVFDSFSLSDGTSMICTDIVDSGPTREIIGGKIPRGDGEYVTAAYFRERKITASGWCKAASAAALDTLLDTIRKSLRNREANLDITDAAGTARRFVATCTNYDQMFAGRSGYDITICPWVAEFTCKVPFGYSRNYGSSFLTINASPTTMAANPGGDYKAYPVVTLTFTAASSVTAIDINNVTTGDDISYSGSVAANDIFIFDGEKKTVTKNGTAVDFSGSFITLEPQGNSVVFTITATSFSASTTIAYKTVYL